MTALPNKHYSGHCRASEYNLKIFGLHKKWGWGWKFPPWGPGKSPSEAGEQLKIKVTVMR